MNDYTLITGATSGIGKELAKLFALNDDNLLLIARNEEALKDLENELKALNDKINVHIKPLDLTLETASSDLYSYAIQNNYNVTKLVNNAGYGDHNAFLTANYEKQIKMIELNIVALVKLCYLFGNQMKKNKKGKILNVASVAGYLIGPYMANYYATKNYVLSFSLALREELKRDNITVTTLCPGPTKTSFEVRAEMKSKTMFHTLKVNEASYVAQKAFKAMNKGKGIVDTGFVSKMGHFSSRLFSRRIIAKACKKINGAV